MIAAFREHHIARPEGLGGLTLFGFNFPQATIQTHILSYDPQ